LGHPWDSGTAGKKQYFFSVLVSKVGINFFSADFAIILGHYKYIMEVVGHQITFRVSPIKAETP
jgi:hypothetical protein